MKHDVFVSYSRTDLAVIEPFVREIEERAGIKCWIDWNGIESGSQFEDVIIEAIDAVDVVLFFLSEHSINSNYAKMEIQYAYNTAKKVIPIVLDRGKLRGWFLFKFGATDYIDIHSGRQRNKLIQNLKDWCVDSGKSNRLASNRQTKTARTATAGTTQIPAEKSWKVGDYYCEKGMEGVVFYVDKSGKHGKIVSIRHTRACWAFIDSSYASYSAHSSSLLGIDTGATNISDGTLNAQAIMKIAEWRVKYPAFAWCADLGEMWYLPAIEELNMLALNKSAGKAVNRTIVSRGGETFKGFCYWSSTELDDEKACCIYINSGTDDAHNKHNYLHVRAVAKF